MPRKKKAEIEEVKVDESKPVKNEKKSEIKSEIKEEPKPQEEPKPKKAKVIPRW